MKQHALVSGLLIFLLFVAGVLFPEPFWGIHSLSFFPLIVKCFVLLAAFVALALIYNPVGLSYLSMKGGPSVLSRLSVSLLVGLLYWIFPIKYDGFGDAYALTNQLDHIITAWDNRILYEIFKFNYFDPKIGEVTTYALSTLGSYLFGISAIEVVHRWEVVAVVLYTWFWSVLVWQQLTKISWRWSVFIMGITGPFMMVFQGHTEIYALPIMFIMGYLVLAYKYFEARNNWPLVALFLSLIIGIKLHILLWLLLPIPVLALVQKFPRLVPFKKLNPLNLRNMLAKWAPFILVLVGVMYFIVQGGIVGTREYSKHDLYSSLFLPIVAAEGPPYDRYGLFSLPHITDMFNLILFWSPAALFILLCGFRLPFSDWNSPWNSALVGVLILFLPLLFIVNPLLGFTTDTDLLSIPVPLFLTLSLALAAKLERNVKLRGLPVSVAVFSIIALSSFWVKADAKMLSKQYETLGHWNFKTFWIGGSSLFESAFKIEESLEEELHRSVKILDDLEPYAVVGLDMEYSEILRVTGMLYADSLGDLQTALHYLNRSYDMDPMLRKTVFNLVITHFRMNRPDLAFGYASRLVAMQYPSARKALRIAIHVSLAADEPQAARNFCLNYLQKFPEDRTINRALQLINSNNSDQALELFKQS